MGKSFKITSDPQPAVYRGEKGRFTTRVVPPAPPQIVRQAAERGVEVNKVIEENRSPEHPTPPGKPNAGEEIPWPAAGPYNDANKKPMNVK